VLRGKRGILNPRVSRRDCAILLPFFLYGFVILSDQYRSSRPTVTQTRVWVDRSATTGYTTSGPTMPDSKGKGTFHPITDHGGSEVQ
jgi:hypothetical protein